MIGDNVTKKEERKYAENREEYFREFHSVVAPVVVLKAYDYERKYDEQVSNNSNILFDNVWNCTSDTTSTGM